MTYRPSFVSTGSSLSWRPRGSLSRERMQSDSSEDHVTSVIKLERGAERDFSLHTEISGRRVMLTIGPGRPLIPGTCRKTITAFTAWAQWAQYYRSFTAKLYSQLEHHQVLPSDPEWTHKGRHNRFRPNSVKILASLNYRIAYLVNPSSTWQGGIRKQKTSHYGHNE